MIVRWTLGELPDVLRELGIERPFFVASPRWGPPVDVAGRWSEVPSHRARVEGDADGLLAMGGGSAIDTAKGLSATTGLPLVSVPTTYSGAEWTTFSSACAIRTRGCAAAAEGRTTRRSSTTST